MSSAMMMERTSVGVPGYGMPGYGSSPVGVPTGFSTGTNWSVVPRCTFKVEKCTGGMKVTCICDDKLASSMVQNLCSMLSGSMLSCCVLMNGLTVCTCNFTMGMCKCELTDQGVCFTCTSGDSNCCEMIQACCDCVCCMMEAGCTCCFLLNSTPVCCGSVESSKSSGKAKSGR